MHTAAEHRDMLLTPRRLSSVTRPAVRFALTLLAFAAAIMAVMGIRFVVFEHFHGNDWIIQRLADALFR